MTTTSRPGDTTRERLLEATGVVLARHGPRKLNLTTIAAAAGVSRPTVYRYFANKDELLQALAAHFQDQYESGLAAKLRGLDGTARLDRALRYVVEFQRNEEYLRQMIEIEPAFMLGRLEHVLPVMAASLVPLFEDLAPSDPRPGAATPRDLADLVVRTALSHYLFRGTDAQLLRELRHVAGIER